MVYNYTKPRGPVAAMYSSPGPCYGLPSLIGQQKHDPRSVHSKGPAYPFGVRHTGGRNDCSPGPCYLPDRKIFRDGKDGTPQYTLHDRTKAVASFKTPGPGTYKPESAGPTSKHMPPAYSFGTRHLHRTTDNTPGGQIIHDRTLPLYITTIIVFAIAKLYNLSWRFFFTYVCFNIIFIYFYLFVFTKTFIKSCLQQN